jgi:hypothetical protein
MLTLALKIQIYIKAECIPAARAISSNRKSPGSKLGSETDREKERLSCFFFVALFALSKEMPTNNSNYTTSASFYVLCNSSCANQHIYSTL